MSRAAISELPVTAKGSPHLLLQCNALHPYVQLNLPIRYDPYVYTCRTYLSVKDYYHVACYVYDATRLLGFTTFTYAL